METIDNLQSSVDLGSKRVKGENGAPARREGKGKGMFVMGIVDSVRSGICECRGQRELCRLL